MLLNIKKDSLVVMLSKLRKPCFGILGRFSLSLCKLSTQILMVSLNSYPRDLIDKYIKEFVDKILAPKPVVSTVPKKELIITLPYLGKLSLQIRTRINRIMKNKLPYCNVQFVFQTKCKISNFFTLFFL